MTKNWKKEKRKQEKETVQEERKQGTNDHPIKLEIRD